MNIPRRNREAPTMADEPRKESGQKKSIEFLNGNRNTPVLNLGDDPSNEENETDNVLVVVLGSAVSVPRETVSTSEGTPEAD